jgi:hypothetical protein
VARRVELDDQLIEQRLDALGRLYDSAWFTRKTGGGPYADVLRLRFERACRRLGFNERTTQPLDTSRFLPPPQKGDQLTLL